MDDVLAIGASAVTIAVGIKKLMEKSYDSVKVSAKYDIGTGKASSKIILEKHGEQFISEFAKDYGAFDTSKQIEFKPMFKSNK